MPQSLIVSGNSSSGSSAKRQRSADSREVQTRPAFASNNQSNDLSRPTVRIPAYLTKSRLEIQQAFQDLEWKQRFRLFHAMENPTTSPFRLDRSEIVISRNRYGNVQPWDNLRIKLKPPIGESDYVNASPITLRSRGHDRQAERNGNTSVGTLQESKYIATQGPKEGQIYHFWQMVMQETKGEVGVVVMLTQCYEAYKEKCSQYFPTGLDDPTIVLSQDGGSNEDNKENSDEPQTSNFQSNDTITLDSISYDAETGSQIRILSLNLQNQSKTIYHYFFQGWPDFGKPEADDRLALVELTRRTRKAAGESPRIVHCSAGVGRTGTFIALDFLTHEIEENRIPSNGTVSEFGRDDATPTGETWGKSGPPKVKTPTGGEFPSGEDNHQLKDDLIYDTVNTLREQRMMMVMNEIQYSFIYEVIRDVFLEKHKGRPEGAVVKGVESGSVDLPRGKVAKVEGGDRDIGSGSEAETEIMEGDEDAAKTEAAEKTVEEGDPYATVAPEHILEGVSKEQQSSQQ